MACTWRVPGRIPASPLEVDGVRFRRPTTRDLALLSTETDLDQIADQLVMSLVIDRQRAGEPSAALASRVASALEAADPEGCAELSALLCRLAARRCVETAERLATWRVMAGPG